MVVQPFNRLVSNPANWTLSYQEFAGQKNTPLNILGAIAISIVAYPLFFIGGIMMSTYCTCKYLNARTQQRLAIKVLTDPKYLQEFANNRVEQLDKQMLSLKKRAIFYIEKRLSKPDIISLPIPQKTWSLRSMPNRNDQLPAGWSDFPWDQFISTDFLALSNCISKQDDKNFDRETLKQLESIRQRMIFNRRQHATLTSNAGDRVELIKKIAQLKFIKNGFEAQDYKNTALATSFWLLPTGFFWSILYSENHNDRGIYEGKKELLLPSTNLAHYVDLVDAHNQLIQNNDFLVPYIHRIK